MTTDPASSTSDDALAWAQLVLTVLDEGRRTATYKLAVLLALIDCCLLGADAHGRPPQAVTVRTLARRVLEQYWPQVRPYARGAVLSQSSQPKAVTVDAVRELPAHGVEVDHFVPWSRLPNDALGNLVLADRQCNGSKRDHYADLPLLERWATRRAAVLEELAVATSWPLRLTESQQVARGLYSHLPAGTPLWQQPGVFTVLDRSRLTELLLALEAT